MSDKKISQLPASTVPLAGSEEVALVQSGATKKVTVANLTVGRPVSVGDLSYTGTLTGSTGILNIGAGQVYKDASGNIGIATSTPAVKLDVVGVARFLSGATGTINYLDVGRATSESRIAVASATNDFLNGTEAGDALFYAPTATNAWYGTAGAKNAIFVTNNTERMRLDINGNASIANGNLVIGTAGKGIDFSADPSAAGMTSELLDDYEEGTWTVEFSDAPSGGNVSSTTFIGQYRKIGSVVHIWFNAANINDTGLTDANVLYFNLPFAGSVRGSSGACRTGALTYPVGTTVITPTSSTSTYGWFFGSGTTVNNLTLTCGALSGNSSDLTDVQITYLTT